MKEFVLSVILCWITALIGFDNIALLLTIELIIVYVLMAKKKYDITKNTAVCYFLSWFLVLQFVHVCLMQAYQSCYRGGSELLLLLCDVSFVSSESIQKGIDITNAMELNYQYFYNSIRILFFVFGIIITVMAARKPKLISTKECKEAR